jgi:phosphatidate cytidylyltransferase
VKDDLPMRVLSSLVGAGLLLLVLWAGIPLILPTLFFVLWLGGWSSRRCWPEGGSA